MKNPVTRKLLILGAAMLILGGAVAGSLLAWRSAAEQPAANLLPPATAQVTRTTLVETRTVSGMLGYGNPVPVSATGTGTLTWLAPVGLTVERGELLYKVDERPVVALYGLVPMYRALDDGAEGTDVRQLQENLAELGYSGFTVDGIYNSATTEAVRAWQADLGLPVTGTVGSGQVVFLPGPVRIAEHTARIGDAIRGAPVLSYTGTDRLVTLDLGVADLALAAEGHTVPVRVPGRGAVAGEVSQIGTVVRNGMVEVTMTVADQEALGPLTAAPVDVDFISQERTNVLAVPVAALLALAEGGYGVEVVNGDTTRIVSVRTGMFAAGRVEVNGEDIAEGVTVGVPR